MQTVSCLRLTFDDVSGCIKPDPLQQSQYYVAQRLARKTIYTQWTVCIIKVELGRTN